MAEGHLEDSPENRQLLQDLANDMKHHVGKDIHGKDRHYKEFEDGSQLWVSVRNGVIQDGGLNRPPRFWDEMTGLSRNIFRRKP